MAKGNRTKNRRQQDLLHHKCELERLEPRLLLAREIPLFIAPAPWTMANVNGATVKTVSLGATDGRIITNLPGSTTSTGPSLPVTKNVLLTGQILSDRAGLLLESVFSNEQNSGVAVDALTATAKAILARQTNPAELRAQLSAASGSSTTLAGMLAKYAATDKVFDTEMKLLEAKGWTADAAQDAFGQIMAKELLRTPEKSGTVASELRRVFGFSPPPPPDPPPGLPSDAFARLRVTAGLRLNDLSHLKNDVRTLDDPAQLVGFITSTSKVFAGIFGAMIGSSVSYLDPVMGKKIDFWVAHFLNDRELGALIVVDESLRDLGEVMALGVDVFGDKLASKALGLLEGATKTVKVLQAVDDAELAADKQDLARWLSGFGIDTVVEGLGKISASSDSWVRNVTRLDEANTIRKVFEKVQEMTKDLKQLTNDISGEFDQRTIDGSLPPVALPLTALSTAPSLPPLQVAGATSDHAALPPASIILIPTGQQQPGPNPESVTYSNRVDQDAAQGAGTVIRALLQRANLQNKISDALGGGLLGDSVASLTTDLITQSAADVSAAALAPLLNALDPVGQLTAPLFNFAAPLTVFAGLFGNSTAGKILSAIYAGPNPVVDVVVTTLQLIFAFGDHSADKKKRLNEFIQDIVLPQEVAVYQDTVYLQQSDGDLIRSLIETDASQAAAGDPNGDRLVHNLIIWRDLYTKEILAGWNVIPTASDLGDALTISTCEGSIADAVHFLTGQNIEALYRSQYNDAGSIEQWLNFGGTLIRLWELA